MRCQRCDFPRSQTFTGEVAIHFPGVEGLTKPLVWVFPEIEICLNCGSTQFRVSPRELHLLTNGAADKSFAA